MSKAAGPRTTTGRRPRQRTRSQPEGSASNAAHLADVCEDWQRYFDLYNFAPVSYIRLDQRGVVGEINQAGCQLLAATQNVILHRPLLKFLAPQSRVDFLEHMRKCRSGTTTVKTELTLVTRDGRVVPVRAISKRSNAMTKQAYWTVLIDPDEQQRLDNAREVAERAVRAEDERRVGRIANESTHRFLNLLSHELRTPLTPALFAASRLIERDMPEQARRLGEIIKRNIQGEAKLIDDLLDVSRIERGSLDLSLGAVDVHAIIREATETCRPLLGKKAVGLGSHLDASLHYVHADPGRLRQVISNLLINAIKYTDDGSVDVGTVNDDGRSVRISVRDTGIGLDAVALSGLFRSFERSQGQSSRGGLGLGLAICRGVVEAHHGHISASSKGPGHGSTFDVELPTIPQPSDDPAQVDTAGHRHPSPEIAAHLRILIVEDDHDTAAILRDLLEQDGHSLRVMHSLKEVRSHVREPWDVVISDLGLPDGSGFDVARYFERVRPKPRLIAFSGYGSDADLGTTAAAGFERHLVKPIDLVQLRRALRA